jgi:hypothetical protein
VIFPSPFTYSRRGISVVSDLIHRKELFYFS